MKISLALAIAGFSVVSAGTFAQPTATSATAPVTPNPIVQADKVQLATDASKAKAAGLKLKTDVEHAKTDHAAGDAAALAADKAAVKADRDALQSDRAEVKADREKLRADRKLARAKH